jgi:hypothetical protein
VALIEIAGDDVRSLALKTVVSSLVTSTPTFSAEKLLAQAVVFSQDISDRSRVVGA